MRSRSLASSLLLLGSIAGSAASTFAIFEDSSCITSSDTIIGEDGYPDGVCTDIRAVADYAYKSFMFINLDDGCTPTIYQNNTTSDTCSGAAYVAYISECYNTSWAYYSIDECTPLTSGSSSSSSSASGSTSDSTSATGSGISGGAIAGAIVGSVCGLGIIAATCVYLFWFRPRQKEREKRERQDAGVAAAAEAEAEVRRREEEEFRAGTKPHELQQQPPELHSPGGTAELPVERVFEAPGDRGAVEVGGAAQLPVELPGDQLDWGLDSDEIKEDGRKYRL